jgi:hypothetical protein
MNLLGAWKKLLLFGLFGAVGCLAGCAIGELYLEIAKAAATSAGADQGPSLISNLTSASSEQPPAPKDFQERLEKAGAKTGDVQMSLIWFNTNDLDLHCVDPRGFEISWQARRSPSGGELDVDRNAGCRNTTAEPVENIYWAPGTAPMGHYQVYLDYYEQCGLGPDESRYQVTVLHGSERKEFSGTITKDQTNARKKLIYEFQLTPLINVVAPTEFQLRTGTKIRIPVAVRRSFYSGKLDLKAENLPEGVTATSTSIETGKNEGSIEFKASDTAATGKKIPIKIVATASDSPAIRGSADLQMELLEPAFSLMQTIIVGIWTALLAVGLSLALLVGQNKYLGRPLFARGRIPLFVAIAGAVLAGFASGSIGQSLYGLFLAIGAGSIGFLIGWMLLGCLLGLGISYFVPNLDRKKAAIAGLVGGLLGAIGYLIGSNAKEWLGHFAGAALLGFCIGLMVAIVEAAFRRIWLEVRYGERETIAVNLGPEPVKVGGDARACTIWARGASTVVLRYFVRDGRVICEDATTRRETFVGNGDTRTVGTVTLTVHTGMVTPTRMPPLPAVPPVSVPPAAPAALPHHRPTPAAPIPKQEIPVSVPPPPRTPVPPVPAPAKAAPPKPTAPAAAQPPPKPPVPATGAAAAPPKPPVPATRPPIPGSPGGVPKPAGSPTGVKPPTPGSTPKPTIPVASAQPPAAPPASSTAGSAKTGDPNACPTCGRITPGRPGARFCMMCDKAY